MPFAGIFWSILLVGAYAITALCFRLLLLPEAELSESVVFGAIFCLFPYATDFMTFHLVYPAVICFLLFCGAFLYFCGRGLLATVAVSVGLCFAASYQLFIPYTLAGILMYSLLRIGRIESGSVNSFRGVYLELKPVFLRVFLFCVCVVVCLLLGKVVMWVSGVGPGDRVRLVPISQFPEQAVMLVKQLSYFLLRAEMSIPIAVKILQLALLGLCVYGLGMKFYRMNAPLIWRVGLFLAAVGMIFSALCVTVGPYLLITSHSHGTITPRAMGGFAFFWSGIFAAALTLNGGWLRRVAMGLGVVLCFSYAMICNQQSVDFARINLRDRVVAGMIVERLAGLEGFEGMRTIVYAGENERFSLGKIDSNTAGFNVSALIRSHAFVPVLLEATGVQFELPKEADFERAKALAEGRPVWPRSGSVFIDGGLGVVVMGVVENGERRK